MPFASSDRVQLRYIPETTFGTTPATNNGINLRMTGESLGFNLTKESDKEITSDAQQVSTTTVNAATGGDVKIHMQYAEYDPLFASVMRSTWNAFGTNGVGATFTADFTATTITASVATSGTSIFTNLVKGQWFKLTAPSHANDGLFLRVSSTTAPTTTVITLDAGTPLATGTTVALCKVSAARLSNGTTLSSFTLEKEMNDVTQFFRYTGMAVSKFSTSFASAALTEGTFTFMGKREFRAATTGLPGTPVASQTYDIQNAVTGVGQLWENGVPLTTTSVKSMSLDIDSALRAQDAIGTLGTVGLGMGTFLAKGSIEVYFADGTLYDKFLNDTYTSIIISTKDASGNGYVFTFPKVMLTSAKVQAGSKNTDLMMSFEYECYKDAANATVANRKTVIIDRLGAAVTPPP